MIDAGLQAQVLFKSLGFMITVSIFIKI